jgi:hypothetical protein
MEKTLELLMECPAADDGTWKLVRRSYLAIHCQEWTVIIQSTGLHWERNP